MTSVGNQYCLYETNDILWGISDLPTYTLTGSLIPVVILDPDSRQTTVEYNSLSLKEKTSVCQTF